MKKCLQRLQNVGVWALVTSMMMATVPGKALAQADLTCATDAIVQAGDTLSTLASKYYGSLQAYRTILTATNAKAAIDKSYATIANPNFIDKGWKLCIPGPLKGKTMVTSTTGAQPAVAAVDPFDTLAIPGMRQKSYPGSMITLEQTLSPGVNYSRYLTTYRSENLKISARLTVPTGPKPQDGWSVIIFNHGYIAPENYNDNSMYTAYEDAFARNGYIVFRPDYRGYGQSEGDAQGGYDAPDYTIDVLNAVASIKQYPDANPDRIGMWGHSLGGYITLRAMVVNGDIKAGVIWAGVVGSLPDLLAEWSSFSSLLPIQISQWYNGLVAAHGTLQQNPTYWASISANNYLADLSGPLQLHHGTADIGMPSGLVDALAKQIQRTGQTAEYYPYVGDDHMLSRNFASAMQRSVGFFDKYLKT